MNMMSRWLEGESKVKGSFTIVDKPMDDLTDIRRISGTSFFLKDPTAKHLVQGGIMMKVWQRERIDDSYHSSL